MNKQMMKQGLRQSIIAARQNMAAAERAEHSRAITLSLLQLPDFKESATVLGYMSFGAEFDTGAWLRQAMKDGKKVLLPKVNVSTKQLEIFQVNDLLNDLAPGAWNILEPLPERCGMVSEHEKIDFVLLPGVAFGRDGSRLGYGGGFYDKLLARIASESVVRKPALAAAAFSTQLVADIPQEATDRRVEWLITEQEVIHCNSA